jgi:hypothetical protein
MIKQSHAFMIGASAGLVSRFLEDEREQEQEQVCSRITLADLA